MVLMAKLRNIIQEDFNLIDAFQYDIQKNRKNLVLKTSQKI